MHSLAHCKLCSICFIEKDIPIMLKDNTTLRKKTGKLSEYAIGTCPHRFSMLGNMAPYPTACVSRSLAQAFIFVFGQYNAKKA